VLGCVFSLTQQEDELVFIDICMSEASAVVRGSTVVANLQTLTFPSALQCRLFIPLFWFYLYYVSGWASQKHFSVPSVLTLH